MVRSILMLVIVPVLSACDVFSTREAEQPGNTGSTFTPPTEPAITVENLRSAILERNGDNYLRCLADTTQVVYIFVPTSLAQSVYDFSRWDKSSEGQYFRNMSAASTGETPQLELVAQDTVRSGSSFSYRAQYYLRFPHTRPQVPIVAEGRLDFTIELSSRDNLWYIVRWVDYPDTSQTTWSHLKGAFLN